MPLNISSRAYLTTRPPPNLPNTPQEIRLWNLEAAFTAATLAWPKTSPARVSSLSSSSPLRKVGRQRSTINRRPGPSPLQAYNRRYNSLKRRAHDSEEADGRKENLPTANLSTRKMTPMPINYDEISRLYIEDRTRTTSVRRGPEIKSTIVEASDSPTRSFDIYKDAQDEEFGVLPTYTRENSQLLTLARVGNIQKRQLERRKLKRQLSILENTHHIKQVSVSAMKDARKLFSGKPAKVMTVKGWNKDSQSAEIGEIKGWKKVRHFVGGGFQRLHGGIGKGQKGKKDILPKSQDEVERDIPSDMANKNLDIKRPGNLNDVYGRTRDNYRFSFEEGNEQENYLNNPEIENSEKSSGNERKARRDLEQILLANNPLHSSKPLTNRDGPAFLFSNNDQEELSVLQRLQRPVSSDGSTYEELAPYIASLPPSLPPHAVSNSSNISSNPISSRRKDSPLSHPNPRHYDPSLHDTESVDPFNDDFHFDHTMTDFEQHEEDHFAEIMTAQSMVSIERRTFSDEFSADGLIDNEDVDDSPATALFLAPSTPTPKPGKSNGLVELNGQQPPPFELPLERFKSRNLRHIAKTGKLRDGENSLRNFDLESFSRKKNKPTDWRVASTSTVSADGLQDDLEVPANTPYTEAVGGTSDVSGFELAAPANSRVTSMSMKLGGKKLLTPMGSGLEDDMGRLALSPSLGDNEVKPIIETAVDVRDPGTAVEPVLNAWNMATGMGWHNVKAQAKITPINVEVEAGGRSSIAANSVPFRFNSEPLQQKGIGNWEWKNSMAEGAELSEVAKSDHGSVLMDYGARSRPVTPSTPVEDGKRKSQASDTVIVENEGPLVLNAFTNVELATPKTLHPTMSVTSVTEILESPTSDNGKLMVSGDDRGSILERVSGDSTFARMLRAARGGLKRGSRTDGNINAS